MGSKSSAIGLFCLVRTIKFLTPWLCRSLKHWWPLAFSGLLRTEREPWVQHRTFRNVVPQPCGNYKDPVCSCRKTKPSFITWGTLPWASKKPETAGLLTWRATATLRVQPFQCPSTKAAFSLLFRVAWGLQLPKHPRCQQQPEASLGAGVSTGWATPVFWSWPFHVHFPKALRRCPSGTVPGSCDNFNR